MGQKLAAIGVLNSFWLLNASLKDLSIALNNHGRHGVFSFLSSLPISVLRNFELEARVRG